MNPAVKCITKKFSDGCCSDARQQHKADYDLEEMQPLEAGRVLPGRLRSQTQGVLGRTP